MRDRPSRRRGPLAALLLQALRLLQANLSARRLATEPTSDVVVSLTTFPARIRLAGGVVECLLRQDVPVRAVVLVLSAAEFRDRPLPWAIRNQVRRGLEVIVHDEDIRSYLKLVPARRRFPAARIVTVDDDKLYPPDWIGDLVRASDAAPGAVVAHHARAMVVSDDGGLHYGWRPATAVVPSERVFPIGSGGVLYPPASLHGRVDDVEAARRVSPTADDHWFWGCSVLAGSRRVCTGRGKPPGIRLLRPSPTLSQVNSVEHGNDRQFQAVLDELGIRAIAEGTVRGGDRTA